ncbi:Fur family transcriptional regulator [Streptomyces salinarius]|uniref:Fur family transcriptional regulator n=1 Tax=Streptomyces salinarius TaxID=2762598 RepID=UPI0028F736C3|nr:transcriptional repressor [Streptomyces salinarius]
MDRTTRAARHDASELPSLRGLLRRHGLRRTAGRLRILSLLRESGQHLTATEIRTRLERTGEGRHSTTVYRSLEALTALDVVHAVPGPGPTRYGITGEPHHHTVCQQCGHVADLAGAPLVDAVRRIEELTGLRPGTSGSLLVYGLCSHCAA